MKNARVVQDRCRTSLLLNRVQNYSGHLQIVHRWRSSHTSSLMPLSLVLVSPNKSCQVYGEQLLIGKDRPSTLVIYDHVLGSIPEHIVIVTAPIEGAILSSIMAIMSMEVHTMCFMSTTETAFSTELLHKINGEVLIGQLSFKQCADLYNYFHQYFTAQSKGSR